MSRAITTKTELSVLPEIITIEEAAQWLRVKPKTLRNWISARKFTEADGLRRIAQEPRIYFPTLREHVLDGTLMTKLVKARFALEPLLAKKAEARMLAGKANPVQISAPGKTRDELGKIAKVSHDTKPKRRSARDELYDVLRNGTESAAPDELPEES